MPPEQEIVPEQPSAETSAPETPPAPDTSTETKPAPSENEVQQALKALEDIQKRFKSAPSSMPSSAPDPEKIREELKEKLGWTDEQLEFHQQSLIGAVAPLQEKIEWMNLEKKHPDMARYKEAMDKELADGYSPAQRANPAILEKVYYLAKGKAMEQQPPSSRPQGQTPRIAKIYPGMGSGVDAGAKTPESTLTDEQKEYARRMHVSEENYRKAMASRIIETAEMRKQREPIR